MTEFLDELSAGEGLRRSRVVAIGECGLDYHYDNSPREAQREVFAAQVALANRHSLALVIHTREAWDDTFSILEHEGVPPRTIFHCFTGGEQEARRCLRIGGLLSFSGIVTFANAAELRQVVTHCPLDHLLIETDSPFLTPVPHRGRRNSPSNVAVVGNAVGAVESLRARSLGCGHLAEHREGLRARSLTSSSPQVESPAVGFRRPPGRSRDRAACCAKHGLHPSKALGQHFVTDPNTVERIARLARVGRGDHVVEIGAGLGSLTVALAATGATVTSVEVDRGIVPVLREMVEPLGVSVVEADAMSCDWAGLLGAAPRWVLVANLPYNVATPLVLDLLRDVPAIVRMLVMVQREAGERLVAVPGAGRASAPCR